MTAPEILHLRAEAVRINAAGAVTPQVKLARQVPALLDELRRALEENERLRAKSA